MQTLDIATSPVFDVAAGMGLAVVLRVQIQDGKIVKYIVHDRYLPDGDYGNGMYTNNYEDAYTVWLNRCKATSEDKYLAPLKYQAVGNPVQ